MVGSYYYLWSQSDWVYTSVYGDMQQRKLNKLLDAEGIDLDRIENMKSYVSQLQRQLQVIRGDTSEIASQAAAAVQSQEPEPVKKKRASRKKKATTTQWNKWKLSRNLNNKLFLHSQII